MRLETDLKGIKTGLIELKSALGNGFYNLESLISDVKIIDKAGN